MTIEQLRELHAARPFRPFTLHLADGRDLHVPHPEFLAQLRSGRMVCVTTERDTFEFIDLLLVASIEVLNGSPRKRRGGNGKAA